MKLNVFVMKFLKTNNNNKDHQIENYKVYLRLRSMNILNTEEENYLSIQTERLHINTFDHHWKIKIEKVKEKT